MPISAAPPSAVNPEPLEVVPLPEADDPWWVVWAETLAIGACTFLGLAALVAALFLWGGLQWALRHWPSF